MASENPATSSYLEETIQGIIFRTATTCSGHYAYLPLPTDFPSVFHSNVLNATIAETLTTAPHFPNITILDSIPSNILYTTPATPTSFHVHNLLTGDHFPIPFPHPLTAVNAAIITHQSCHFKLLVVCTKPLAFHIYSSETQNWSHVEHAGEITADQLLPCRKKPIHAGEEVLYLDLTDRFLIRFNYEEQLLYVPKLDEATARYGDCNGWLHCAKIDAVRNRVEVYVWTMEPPKGLWRLVVAGEDGGAWGKVVALHPFRECMLFVRMEVDDAILLFDVGRDLQWDVVGGRGLRCGPACYGVTGMEGGAGRRSDCGILHPHEKDEGPEGEIFVVSLSTKRPELR